MKRFLQLCLLIVFACSGAIAQETKVQKVQQPPPTNVKVIMLEPGTSKNLPGLFSVATKTILFLNIADELGLSADQKAALTEIHQNLQTRAEEVKLNYEKENRKLQTILSSDRIELENMRENLHASEQLKAEMQYYLFEALLKAANVLTPEQQMKVLERVETEDVK